VNLCNFERVHGAGTALIKAIARQTSQGMLLESTATAVTFYQKIGFEKVPHNKQIFFERTEGGCVPMVLTAEKLRRLALSRFSTPQ
jgi:hypothetical protein